MGLYAAGTIISRVSLRSGIAVTNIKSEHVHIIHSHGIYSQWVAYQEWVYAVNGLFLFQRMRSYFGVKDAFSWQSSSGRCARNFEAVSAVAISATVAAPSKITALFPPNRLNTLCRNRCNRYKSWSELRIKCRKMPNAREGERGTHDCDVPGELSDWLWQYVIDSYNASPKHSTIANTLEIRCTQLSLEHFTLFTHMTHIHNE